jgi:alkanesulfonate monooxygenase SsuD/methylene tetrahydromethanopterin reductase-like flavin-dependent oxidoreductase (luciferase family)
MDVGIGLPNAVKGVDRAGIVEWARKAEEHGFSALGTIDRIVYDNYESLIALAAAAAVTERIRLTTDILIAPLRTNTALLAKQSATLDSLSQGRLVLGLAVGGREDDFAASGIDYDGRGTRFERQLEEMKRIWRGESVDGAGSVGPPPTRDGGPELLLGGRTERTIRRAAKYGDGFTMGGGAPDEFKRNIEVFEQAWQAEGREGNPRKVALFYFSLGPQAQENAQRNLGDYYAFLGEYAQGIIESTAKDAETISQYLDAFEQAGADELIAFPASPDVEQVDLLADAVRDRL